MRIHGMVSALALFMAAGAGSALADDGGMAGTLEARARAVTVVPDPSATITVGGAAIGGKTSISDSTIPELDFTYFFTDNLSADLIAGVTRHTIRNSAAGRVASVSLLPPTLTVLYHFDPNGPIRPYLGAGLNYTIFYDADSALPQIKFKDNVGYALQGGVDLPVGNGPYFLNFDVKKLFLNTSVSASGGAVRAHASLDPWLIGAGVGIRF